MCPHRFVRGEGPPACRETPQARGPPRGPYREGRPAAPLGLSPRTVRLFLDCGPNFAPHSQDMGVDHRGAHILVPQELLDGPDVVAIFEQMGREGVTNRATGSRFGQPGAAGGFLDGLWQNKLVQAQWRSCKKTKALCGTWVRTGL